MISNRDYIRDIPILRKLKKCPFCGSNVFMSQTPLLGCFAVHCQNEDCGADVYFYGADYKPGEMVERWNRRTENDVY